MTPLAVARVSAEQQAKARRILDIYRLQLVEKEKWLAHLEREVQATVRRQEVAALFIKNKHPKLPGQVSPREFTKDKKTMEQCLALIRR
jgi:hypothetical protein